MNSSFSVFECPFKDVEPPFKDAERTFNVVEVRDAAARLVVELLRLHIPERAEEHFAVFAI